MKVEVGDNSEIVLKEVFNGIGLETPDGETMGIAMRDGGFEFNYGGSWYSAKEGVIQKLGDSLDSLEVGS